ncbi:MAG: ParB N-terminal domain-containing protein [Mangrovicoccus sp.]|nr:ParB N-terminal domain-containing protein [Mangrovicoccus sp.]
MARRRLTPAQPGYLGPVLGPVPGAAPETKSALPGGGGQPAFQPVIPPIAQVSGQSAEAAALREITQGIEAARAEGRMVVEVPLADIAPGHLARDRIALEREDLDALKASIRSHGQRVPAEITPLAAAVVSAVASAGAEGAPAHAWGLISGWRRLRALSELYDETGDPRFSVLRALLRPPGEAAASYVAMVEENEIRVGLSYYERARIVAEATARGVFPDQSAALRSLFATASRAKRSKIASFIDIHEDLGDLLHFPAGIPERLGLALVSRLRFGDRIRIRAALAEARPATAAAENALLERLARAPRPDVSRAKPAGEVLRPGVAMRVERKAGRIAVSLSGKGVDDALLEEVRAALRRLGRG